MLPAALDVGKEDMEDRRYVYEQAEEPEENHGETPGSVEAVPSPGMEELNLKLDMLLRANGISEKEVQSELQQRTA